ncbi:MAG: hypothetical protein NXY59_03490 [Aigarchaeota archaeon]|nr:hypothetical protein [Candidatus Pelearchaeum maunauluense]
MLSYTFVVVWEGIDGAGKTTLLEEVSKILEKRGYRVGRYKTPSDTATGRIAKIVGNSAMIDPLTRMFLFLANTSDDSTTMSNAIEHDKPSFYFIDRYYLCSIIYGLALIEKRTNTPLSSIELKNFLNLVEKLGSKIFIKPDAYIVVVVDEETRLRRLSAKQERPDITYELDTQLQNKALKLYEEFKNMNPEKVIWVENRDGALKGNADKIANDLIRRREKALRIRVG